MDRSHLDRRHLITSGLAVLGVGVSGAAARAQSNNAMPAPNGGGPNYHADTFSQDELVNSVSDFFGVTAEDAGAVISHVFRENGRPTGYIAGEEGAGAFGIGLRYGKG